MNNYQPIELKTQVQIAAAKEAFHKVFKTSYSFGNPFTPDVERKAIIFHQMIYAIDEKHYEALRKVAYELGETDAYISAIEGYKEKEYLTKEDIEFARNSEYGNKIEKIWNLKFEERDHWLVDLKDYPFHDVLLVMGGALYSTKGTWGILFSEFGHALIGGSSQFFQSLIVGIPDLEAEVYEFLKFVSHHLNKYPDTTKVIKSWLPSMLDQIYGRKQAQVLLKESNLSDLDER